MKKILNSSKYPVKIWASELESEAEKQSLNLANLPFIHKHVALMSDAHSGKGSTVGTVLATKGAIIPAAVGVDCGCGMSAILLPFKIDQFKNLQNLRAEIERSIPSGHHENNKISDSSTLLFNSLGQVKCPKFQSDDQLLKARKQLGSLGGGNHFIEICGDQNGDAWIMLHSGSRNIGKCLAEYHIDKAKGLMKQYFINLPDPDLAFLAQNTPEFDNYIHDLHWAQKYAKANRDEMMSRVIYRVFRHIYGVDADDNLGIVDSLFRVDCHHNYTQKENHFGSNVWVTRKGAVSAKEGEFGIIPGSMGAKSFIVRGRGNPESFNSCSHGAGRKMSRTKARAMFTAEDLAEQTKGVECRKDSSLVDEIPGAYKSIEEVMENQKDLVEIVYTLKQILCIKGD